MQTGKRNIKSGIEYNKYFGAATQVNIDLPKADVYQTLEFMEKLVYDTLSQTSKIAQKLKSRSHKNTCRNIFDFIYTHIQYKPDQVGVEQLRTPNRTWADRSTGVDCDCYSIFISSILSNLGIKHYFRITKYNGKPNFQHVYVVVPKDGKSLTNKASYFVIDPVLDAFNDEKPYSEKFDKVMKIPHQILNGITDTSLPFGREFDHLNGLGSTNDFLFSLKTHLQNTLAQLNKNPKVFSLVVEPEIFKEQLEYVLENWNDPVAREGALEEIAEMEELGENEPEVSVVENNAINGFGSISNSPVLSKRRRAKLSVEGSKKKVQFLRNRRKQQQRVVPATVQRGTLKSESKFNAICSCHMNSGVNGYYTSSLSGLSGLGGFFSKIKTAVKNTVNKVKEGAKKVGKAVVKYNPLTVAARGGLLLVMKTNLFGIAKKIKYGYLSESQARAKNMNLLEWKKVQATVHKMEKLFQTVGGDPKNLKNAILNGKSGGLDGLGAVATSAAVTAASGLIAKITAWLKNIDFKNLFNSAKDIVNKASQFSNSNFLQTATSSPQIISPSASQPVNQRSMPTIELPEHTVVADKPKKSSSGLVMGLVAAGVLGALMLNKKKGLNGVVESISI